MARRKDDQVKGQFGTVVRVGMHNPLGERGISNAARITPEMRCSRR